MSHRINPVDFSHSLFRDQMPRYLSEKGGLGNAVYEDVDFAIIPPTLRSFETDGATRAIRGEKDGVSVSGVGYVNAAGNGYRRMVISFKTLQ